MRPWLRDNLPPVAILAGVLVWLASGLTGNGFAACMATTIVLLAAIGAASKHRPLRGRSDWPRDGRPIAPPPAPLTSVVPAALLRSSTTAAAPPRPASPPPPPRPASPAPPPGPSKAEVARHEVVRSIHHLFWFKTLPRFLERLPDVAQSLASDELDDGFARALCAPEGPIVSYVTGMAADLKVGAVELPVASAVRRPFGVALVVFQPGLLVDFTTPRAVALVPRRAPARSLCFTLEEGLSFGDGMRTFVGSLTPDDRWLRHRPLHESLLGPRPTVEQVLEDFLAALEPLVACGGAGGEPHPHRPRPFGDWPAAGGPAGSVLSSELPEPGGPPTP